MPDDGNVANFPRRRQRRNNNANPPRPEDDARPADYSDDAIALQFIDENIDNLRYVNMTRKWLKWDSSRWKADTVLKVFSMVRKLCRNIAANAPEQLRRKLKADATIAGIERMSRSDQRIACVPEQFDTHEMLLGVNGGTVDLTTGLMISSDPNHFITKSTSIAPADTEDCPLFLDFIHKINLQDREMVDFEQRWLGYCLTGSIKEHKMFFGYGTGRNGKSTLLELISHIMGEYAKAAGIETFVESRNDRHPTEIAKLMGARFVTATETQEGRHWNESRLKSLTGGDTVSARFMRRDEFEFVPGFKINIVGNNLPQLRNVDDAMRSRMCLVPFTLYVPEEERDLDLGMKLRSEAPGILRWCITGCLEWQRHGLMVPQSIRAATTEYLDSQDVLTEWMATCCEVRLGNLDLWAQLGALYESYKAFCLESGDEPMGRRTFSERLVVNKGFAKSRNMDGTIIQGLRLRRRLIS
jgi:putative DNA primase/helicase